MQVQETITSKYEAYFSAFREHIVGFDQSFVGPYGRKKIIYADWTASGRLYGPIEDRIKNDFGPFLGNTHTETSITGTSMTHAYHMAKHIIKRHVGATDEDILIPCGTGMTGAVNKFQRILGLRIPEQLKPLIEIPEAFRPIVFVTHMEHHSNHTTWLETCADVEIIKATPKGMVDLKHLKTLLKKYEHRKVKIAAVISGSNITGLITPYHKIAKIMHQHGGKCFVDFACSAPYVDIDMHPKDPLKKLDAIYFSPHKFLGGPGTSGMLVFCSTLYDNQVPDHPGGGTVLWTDPWGRHEYHNNIEDREDGGTPGFLQTIKAALSVKLKEQMGVPNILAREHELVEIIFKRFKTISNLHILAGHLSDRLGVISFYIEDLHFNLCTKILNDRFGIQVRGGCSCAGTYGHYLLNVDEISSRNITTQIKEGNLSSKPGWVRMSIHPTMTNEEVHFICASIEAVAANFNDWQADYTYSSKSNEFSHKLDKGEDHQRVQAWFDKEF